MLALYNTLAWAAKPIALGWAAWRGRDPERADEWAQRTARRLPRPLPGCLWLHGSSVGEARIVASLATALRERSSRSQAVSAFTATGYEQLPDADARFVLPLDFRGYPTRLLERLEPGLLILVETELWPNLIHETAASGIPLVLANARLSPERMVRYRRWSGLYGPLLRRFAVIGAQSSEDAERLVEIGANPDATHVTGNMKYDLRAPQVDRTALQARLALDGRPVWVAGSTRPGEEAVVLAAFEVLRRSVPELLLVLAPRHLDRLGEVLQLVRDAGRDPLPWSSTENADSKGREVIVVDTLGDLAALYAIADLAFVGGSLRPFGGHSPLEPAVSGVPVLLGPHTDHFEEPARELVESGGARRVHEETDLIASASAWLADRGLRDRAGAAARETVNRHSGALRRTVELLDPLLEDPR